MDCSPPGSSIHGIFQAKSTGVSLHFLLQGIVPIQRSDPRLLLHLLIATSFLTTALPCQYYDINTILNLHSNFANCLSVASFWSTVQPRDPHVHTHTHTPRVGRVAGTRFPRDSCRSTYTCKFHSLVPGYTSPSVLEGIECA